MMNAVGAGIGGSSHPSTRSLITAYRQAWGPGEAPILGHPPGLTPGPSAAVNAFMVTQFDFDDAYGKAIVHPGASAIAGLLAVSGSGSVTGADALAAFGLGCEAQLIIARAISPSHYRRGWHTSATCAAVGAATAAGLVLGLGENRLALALDLAMMQVVGLRQAHGTTMKGYQVGRGAANGVESALHVSEEDFDVPEVLGVHPGFLSGITDEPTESQRDLLENDRGVWELLDITYKAYPVGMVCITGVEAAIGAAQETGHSEIISIRLKVNPLVVELAGNPEPQNEMEARVSLPHAVAVAISSGQAGLPQFTESAIHDPIVQSLRQRVELSPDPDLELNSTVLEIETTTDVRCWRVEEPLGGSARPLSDSDLRAKVETLVEPVAPGSVGA